MHSGFGGLPSLLLLGAGLFTANYLMISGRLHATPGAWRILITLVFGLIHGFGFAADLLEMQLPLRAPGRTPGGLQRGGGNRAADSGRGRNLGLSRILGQDQARSS